MNGEEGASGKGRDIVLVQPGRVETRYPSIEEATAAGERFLLDHPSECSVALYEICGDGREGLTRKIFHWRDEFFHYLDMPRGGRGVGSVFRRPCRRPMEAKECGRA